MAKSKAIQWLESETGQTIDFKPTVESAQDRHLSVRVTSELAAELEALASERNLSVSQAVRELLADAVARRQAVAGLDTQGLVDRLAADVAEVTRRLAG
ncbi:MAG: ribbon-helix-helix protein, CopG family [Actinomycetia bacterium]|nr:ribbon-helix-helix protein, CopG family [Actinomycetes bacterium]